LDQAALAILPLVVRALNVMAGIAFVAAELDGAVYEDGQVDIDLDQTVIAALIPIVGAPALTCHKLYLEVLIGRQLYIRERAPAALGDRGAHDGVESGAWNDVAIAKRFYALGQCTRFRKQSLNTLQHRIVTFERTQLGREREQTRGFVAEAK